MGLPTSEGSDHLNRQLNFLAEIDALKSVYRASKLTGEARRENSAEHSWHIIMFATVLAEHANEPVDTWKVVRMLMVHDIVEIDTEDLPLHAPPDPNRQAKEQAAAERLFGLLPEPQAKQYLELWEEFENGQSAESVFARSIDRYQPILQNKQTEGGTWPEYDVTLAQMHERTGHIKNGSATLWEHAKTVFQLAMANGWIKP